MASWWQSVLRAGDGRRRLTNLRTAPNAVEYTPSARTPGCIRSVTVMQLMIIVTLIKKCKCYKQPSSFYYSDSCVAVLFVLSARKWAFWGTDLCKFDVKKVLIRSLILNKWILYSGQDIFYRDISGRRKYGRH